MYKRALPKLLSLSIVAVCLPAPAAAWLSSGEIEHHCGALRDDPQSEAAMPCAAFLQGFLAGVAAHAARVRALAGADEETFTDRAARTRIGTRLRLARMDEIGAPAYCLTEDVTVRHLLESLLAYYDEHPSDLDFTANEVLHQALVDSFPCDA